MSETTVTESVTNVTPIKADEEKRIADLLTKKNGNISAVAKSLKIARKTVYAKIKISEVLQDALEDSREKSLDEAEDMLGRAVRQGEAWAVCFTLKTQGKSRGYVERNEISGANGNPIETTQTIRVIKPRANEVIDEPTDV